MTTFTPTVNAKARCALRAELLVLANQYDTAAAAAFRQRDYTLAQQLRGTADAIRELATKAPSIPPVTRG